MRGMFPAASHIVMALSWQRDLCHCSAKSDSASRMISDAFMFLFSIKAWMSLRSSSVTRMEMTFPFLTFLSFMLAPPFVFLPAVA